MSREFFWTGDGAGGDAAVHREGVLHLGSSEEEERQDVRTGSPKRSEIADQGGNDSPTDHEQCGKSASSQGQFANKASS